MNQWSGKHDTNAPPPTRAELQRSPVSPGKALFGDNYAETLAAASTSPRHGSPSVSFPPPASVRHHHRHSRLPLVPPPPLFSDTISGSPHGSIGDAAGPGASPAALRHGASASALPCDVAAGGVYQQLPLHTADPSTPRSPHTPVYQTGMVPAIHPDRLSSQQAPFNTYTAESGFSSTVPAASAMASTRAPTNAYVSSDAGDRRELRQSTETGFNSLSGSLPRQPSPVTSPGVPRSTGRTATLSPPYAARPPQQPSMEPAGPPPCEFILGTPQHRSIVVLLAVASLGVAPLLSSLSCLALICGCGVTYIAHIVGYEWPTVGLLAGTGLVLAVSLVCTSLLHFPAPVVWSQVGPLCLSAALVLQIALSAAYVMLHFRWLQVQFPAHCCLLERLIVAVAPVASLPALTSMLMAAVGAQYTAPLFLVLVCALHTVFYTPVYSSFLHVYQRVVRPLPSPEEADETQKEVEEPIRYERVPQQLNERMEAIWFTCVCVFAAPVLLYNVLQSNWAEKFWDCCVQSMALLLAAMAYLCATPSTSLWFLAPDAPEEEEEGVEPALETDATKAELKDLASLLRQLHYDPLGLHQLLSVLRRRVLYVAALFLCPWFAAQMVHSRYAFLFSGAPYPYNWIALTVSFYLIAAAVLETHFLLQTSDAEHETALLRRAAEEDEVERQAAQKAEKSTSTASAKDRLIATRRGLMAQRKQQYAALSKAERRRRPAVLALVFATLLIAVLLSVPAAMIPFLLIAVGQMHFFLLEFEWMQLVSFMVPSTWLLLWWMYRTFSYMVTELKVYGEPMTVYNPVVALNVLLCYVLGCLSFGYAFHSPRGLFICLLFLSMRLGWVEHVLYSQQEEWVYPGVLVFLTGIIGITTVIRLHTNNVLGKESAFVVGSSFIAKMVLYVIERSSYAYTEDLVAMRHSTTVTVLELKGSFYAALIMGYTIFEMERRRQQRGDHSVGDANQRSRWFFILYAVASFLLALATVRNVQRAVYELVTQGCIALPELPHVAPGTVCITFYAFTAPFYYRHASRSIFLTTSPFFIKFSTAIGAMGLVLLTVQPTRVLEDAGTGLDQAYDYFVYGRVAVVGGFLLLCLSRMLPLHNAIFPVRAVAFGVMSALLGFGLTATLLPVPTLGLCVCLAMALFLALMILDLAHYHIYEPSPSTTPSERQAAANTLTGAGASLFVLGGLLLAVLALGALSLRFDTIHCLIDSASAASASRFTTTEGVRVIQSQARLRLLALASVLHLFMAIVLKCRAHERDLFPGARPLRSAASLLCSTSAASPLIAGLGDVPGAPVSSRSGPFLQKAWRAQKVADPAAVYAIKLACNLACLIAVAGMTLLNTMANQADPLMVLLMAPLLLLLETDNRVFRFVASGNQRYLPPVAWCLAWLWWAALRQSAATAQRTPFLYRRSWWHAAVTGSGDAGIAAELCHMLLVLLPTIPAQLSMLDAALGPGGPNWLRQILSLCGVIAAAPPAASVAIENPVRGVARHGASAGAARRRRRLHHRRLLVTGLLAAMTLLFFSGSRVAVCMGALCLGAQSYRLFASKLQEKHMRAVRENKLEASRGNREQW